MNISIIDSEPNLCKWHNKIKARAYCGFSLVELFVCVAIVGVLSALLLPAVSKAKSKSISSSCISNFRQIGFAIDMYCSDNSNRYPPNNDGQDLRPNWVGGNLSDPDQALNSGILLNRDYTVTAPYLKSGKVFKCTADLGPWIRSVSLNNRINPIRLDGPGRWLGGQGTNYQIYISNDNLQSPSEVFGVVDESDSSINDAYFVTDLSNTGEIDGSGASKKYYLVDAPASRHSRAATFHFLDGHVELRTWVDSEIIRGRLAGPFSRKVSSGDRDLAWLQSHAAFVRP
jgi:prepilin-type N-terminal cleavage/methylation domain-containing protein/prepilin-type processing-associated H-X9-DG protein